MRYLHLATAVLGLASLSTHAATFDPNELGLNCSGALSIDARDHMKLSCGGKLSMSGGRGDSGLLASQSLTIEASGDITLDHLNITSKSITLASEQGAVFIHPTVTFFRAGNEGGQPAIVIRTGNIVDYPDLYPTHGSISSNISLNFGNSVQLNVMPATPLAAPVPEPGAWVLAAAGLSIAALMARRRASMQA